MLHLRANGNIIYTTTEEKPGDRDYEKLGPFLQEIATHHDHVNWYFEIGLKDWQPESKWKDAKVDIPNSFKFKKIALVADESLKEQMTNLISPFNEAEVRFYAPEKKDEAKLWID